MASASENGLPSTNIDPRAYRIPSQDDLKTRYEPVVEVMEELVKFTLLTRDAVPCLVDRYSERKESAEELSRQVNRKAL